MTWGVCFWFLHDKREPCVWKGKEAMHGSCSSGHGELWQCEQSLGYGGTDHSGVVHQDQKLIFPTHKINFA